jgi:SPOR domain
VTPPVVAARRAEETRKAVQNLAGAACVEFSGIAAADAARGHDAFAALQLGSRLTERRVEEISRYWVFIPAVRDRKVAEATMAQLRRQGVLDLSIRPDNAISLGVFSTEDAARRFLTTLEAKGVRGAEQGPFIRELRELVMLIREPDTELVARLAVLQRDYAASQLRAVPCPSQ